MNVLTITLLIANLVTVAAGATVIGKEINKLNKKLDEYDANLSGNDISSIRKEIKEHISKEFMAMTFRTIKIQDLRKGRES